LENEWLENELEAVSKDSNAPHTILFMHHPPALTGAKLLVVVVVVWESSGFVFGYGFHFFCLDSN
jgi:hypothetical protein